MIVRALYHFHSCNWRCGRNWVVASDFFHFLVKYFPVCDVESPTCHSILAIRSFEGFRSMRIHDGVNVIRSIGKPRFTIFRFEAVGRLGSKRDAVKDLGSSKYGRGILHFLENEGVDWRCEGVED